MSETSCHVQYKVLRDTLVDSDPKGRSVHKETERREKGCYKGRGRMSKENFHEDIIQRTESFE